jgi:uncharacterized cofD-like protein
MLKWLTIGINIKRWILLLLLGIGMLTLCLSFALLKSKETLSLPYDNISWLQIILGGIASITIASLALLKLTQNLLAPYRFRQQGRLIDVVYAHSRRHKGSRVVVIGGGTGLPSVLRGLKAYTSNITAVVTVADDGGSSGRLRRDLGVLPPGDIRNNIVALADDESLMTQLFQYRFGVGDLGGHSFGNLFIAAMAGVSGGLENALPEIERVLNIQGRVLPSTLQDVNLVANVRLPGKTNTVRIKGESKIADLRGRIEDMQLLPPDIPAYEESVEAIAQADIIIIGPGSLFTSIMPNLLVNGIAQALRESSAQKIYVCNVATQPGETDGFNVADHVAVIENTLGRGVLNTILANNATPTANAQTHYVMSVPDGHDLKQRYTIVYTDLTDNARPWRHDPQKLTQALWAILDSEKTGTINNEPVLLNT